MDINNNVYNVPTKYTKQCIIKKNDSGKKVK